MFEVEAAGRVLVIVPLESALGEPMPGRPSRALTAIHRAVAEVILEAAIIVDAGPELVQAAEVRSASAASAAEECARRAMRACTHCGPTTLSPRVTRDVAPRLGWKKPALVHSKFFPALQGCPARSHPRRENMSGVHPCSLVLCPCGCVAWFASCCLRLPEIYG